MMQAQLQNLRSILRLAVDSVQLSNRFAAHAQLGITAGRSKSSFKIHPSLLSRRLAKLRQPASGRRSEAFK